MMDGFATGWSLFKQGIHLLQVPPAAGIALWLLVGVFTWSGIAKLRRPALAALAMVDFGVARRGYPWMGRALGAAEAALAAALIVVPHPALAVATGLLWLFVVLVARSLLGGEQFACFCFGDSGDRLSTWTLARTTALALLSTTLLLAPPLSLLAQGTAQHSLYAVGGAAMLGISVLARRVHSLLRWNSLRNDQEVLI